MLQILHNPKCSKSNCALDYLHQHQIEFEIRDYQQNPLSREELKNLCELLQVSPEAIVRKNEKLFQEKFAEKNYSDDEWFDILAAHPILLQRPIVIAGKNAVIARPAEKIENLLSR